MATEAAGTLLRSAAPGHFDVVAENVAKLGSKTLSGNWREEYELEQQRLACIGVDESMGAVSSHPLTSQLKEKLKAYQQKTFGKNKVTSRIALVPGESPQQLVVKTYAEKLDAANQYTGYWKGTWTIEGSDICGDVQVRTCTYEEGNSQLQAAKVFDAKTFSGKADDVIEQILDWENEVLGMLTALHDLTADHLRQIRRVLPITKTKMKWDVVAQRSVKHLKKTAKR